MTRWARGALGVFHRAGAESQATEPSPSSTPMAVEARIPAGVAPSVITHLEDGLRATVATRAAELGIDREMAVEVVPNEAQANTAAVSAAGRPLAVRIASASSEYGEAWADDVIRAVDQALLRRLSFLLDAPSTQRRAALLQERFSDDRRELFHAIPGYLLDNGVALEDPGLPDDTPVPSPQRRPATARAGTPLPVPPRASDPSHNPQPSRGPSTWTCMSWERLLCPACSGGGQGVCRLFSKTG